MAIKVTKNDVIEKAEQPFPKLMQGRGTGRIVYMTKPSCGLCVDAGEARQFLAGVYSDGWNMDAFTDYNGPVTLQNEDCHE